MAKVVDWSKPSRDPKYYTYNGRRLRLSKWAEVLHVSVPRLTYHINTGRDPTAVLASLAGEGSMPPIPKRRKPRPGRGRRKRTGPFRRPNDKRLTILDTANITKYWLTFQGETRSLADWCRRLKVPYEAIRKRILRGVTAENVLLLPVAKRAKYKLKRKPKGKRSGARDLASQ